MDRRTVMAALGCLAWLAATELDGQAGPFPVAPPGVATPFGPQLPASPFTPPRPGVNSLAPPGQLGPAQLNASAETLGLANARVWIPGDTTRPGRWEIRGTGTGPLIVDGQVILPNTGVRRDAQGNIANGRQMNPLELLAAQQQQQVQQRQRAQQQLQPPITIVDMSYMTVPQLLENVESRELGPRASAIVALGDTREPGQEAVRKLLAALDDDDLRIAKLAALSLGKLGAVTAVDKLIEMLDVDDREMIAIVAEALTKIGLPRALAPLREIANLPDPQLARVGERAVALIERRRERIDTAMGAPAGRKQPGNSSGNGQLRTENAQHSTGQLKPGNSSGNGQLRTENAQHSTGGFDR